MSRATRCPCAIDSIPGITLTVPLALLNQVDAARLGWLVPGMVREKIHWYLKSLPKALRNRETPLPPVVTAFLLAAEDESAVSMRIEDSLREFLEHRWRTRIAPDVWDDAGPSSHLVVNLRVVDAAGRELAAGRDLRALRSQLGEAAQLTFASSDPGIERTGMKTWDVGDLPETISFLRNGQRLTGHPAIVDEGTSVGVKMIDTADAATHAHRKGVVRLLRLALNEQLKQLEKGSGAFNAIALQLRSRVAPDKLRDDMIDAIADRAFISDDPLPRTALQFDAQKQRARTRLPAVRDGMQRILADIARGVSELNTAIAAAPTTLRSAVRSVEAHRDRLVYPGFLAATDWEHISQLPRYLEALVRRLRKASENPDRDGRHGHALEAWRQAWETQRAKDEAAGRSNAGIEDFRWWIEELAVALFAQELKTPFPVSQKRLEKRWSDLTR